MPEPKRVSLSLDNRSYVIDGKVYTRVSEIVDIIPNAPIDSWRVRVGEEEAARILEETSEWGSAVHLATELNDNGKNKELDLLLANSLSVIPPWLAWVEWTREYVKKWVAIEKVVWSDKYQFAGRIDRVAIMVGDRDPSILDIKTGGIYNDTGIPAALYMMAYNERNRKKVRRRILVNLPRKRPGDISIREPGPKKMAEENRKALEALKTYDDLIWRE